MSTSPYYDGSTSVVLATGHRAGPGRAGVTSYIRERDFPRATRYNTGMGYNLGRDGYNSPYDSYDLTLAEQRELEEIRLAEYRRNEYSRAGAATIITTGDRGMRGGKTIYLSGRPGMDRYQPLGHTAGVRTVSVERSGPIIHHRAATRYTNQPFDYAIGDYANDYEGLDLDAYRVPAGGRLRRYPTRYDSRGVFGAHSRYEGDYREPLVVVPAVRTTRYR